MRIFIWLLMAGGLFLAGCCDEKEPVRGFNVEFMVFGHFYGKCGGEGCVEIFMIEDGKLYEDTLDMYPGSTAAYQGQWAELSSADFELVKDILDDFPKMLLHETETVIGMPDAGDWAGSMFRCRCRNNPFQTDFGYWINMRAICRKCIMILWTRSMRRLR